jgi:hypothetical protein
VKPQDQQGVISMAKSGLKRQYAKCINRSAKICEDFGMEMFIRYFGIHEVMALLEQIPVYASGKNKGKPKGYVCWTHVTEGGWINTGPAYHGSATGHVLIPGTRNVRFSMLPRENIEGGFGPGMLPTELDLGGRVERYLRGLTEEIRDEKRARARW